MVPQKNKSALSVFKFLIALFFLGCLLATNRPLAALDLRQSVIQLVNGTSIEGSIVSVDADGNVVGSSIPEGLNLLDILAVRTARKARPIAENSVLIHVVGGGQIRVGSAAMADEKITFRSGSGVTELPLQATRAVVWSSSDLVESALKQPSKENDQVVVETANGDRSVEGILESIDAQFVTINYKGESKKIGLAKVKAIVSADLGLSGPKGSLATISLADESTVVGVISGIANDELEMAVGGGASLRLKTSNVISLSIASDYLVYLSDINPIDVQEKSVFALQRSWKRDRSVENNALKIRLKGSEKTIQFNKGLGTQSASRLVFENTNGFDRFGAVVGIDAETEGRGDCQMVVRGDGIELWSKRVQASDGPQTIDVDITDMKEVALIVYPGEEFDLGDHADWGEARFLKTK